MPFDVHHVYETGCVEVVKLPCVALYILSVTDMYTAELEALSPCTRSALFSNAAVMPNIYI